jgi:uncharacterized damage-inducible protein DinB
MEQNLESTIALLECTPRTMNALLRDLPAEWTLANEGEGMWSAFDIVGHLIHCERVDWMPRARIILEYGESKPFEPLDREAQKGESVGKALSELLDEFARLRTENLVELRALNLGVQALAKRGMHPAFGAVTLSELLAAWAVHDLTHLHQLSRVMARQYAEGVGPWTRYLGVLRCVGNSDM